MASHLRLSTFAHARIAAGTGWSIVTWVRVVLTIGYAVGYGTATPQPVSGQVVEQSMLRSPQAGQEQLFGIAVACEDDSILVGERLGGVNYEGGAYLWNTQTTAFQALRASDRSYIDLFGSSVAMSGNAILIGAPGNDDFAPADVNSDSGSAYLFD